ncbi:MAG: hypothetical protein ACRDNL_21525 [Spirillospora sp.]
MLIRSKTTRPPLGGSGPADEWVKSRTKVPSISHWTGRATVAMTRPRPSAQAQVMMTALQDQAARLYAAP